MEIEKKKKDHHFVDLSDIEYYDSLENNENLKKGIISDEEFKKNEYVRKTRENLVGGDA